MPEEKHPYTRIVDYVLSNQGNRVQVQHDGSLFCVELTERLADGSEDQCFGRGRDVGQAFTDAERIQAAYATPAGPGDRSVVL